MLALATRSTVSSALFASLSLHAQADDPTCKVSHQVTRMECLLKSPVRSGHLMAKNIFLNIQQCNGLSYRK
ncbi:hypothetical protein KP509_12G075300 [Ceratopteris richardii]|uniref:Uncharacterized protein n=1 Tax=Ceratopteris richardii TaxID=49495 RepID=A0A8T2TQU5_CERRI|nr:hypothetical protein KP509_12G075300 [Ceratopteris richardii]